jgi:hypothetical protein
MTDSSSQRDESESASTPAIADAPTEDAVFDMPSCMPGEALYNCDLLTPEEYKNATNTGAQLIQLVSEMLRTVDESIRESEAKGENRLSMNETLTDLLVATEVPPERPTIQLAVKHAPEQYLPSADDSHRSSASFSGFPDKFPESIRETLPPEADPFAIREGMTLAWKDVNLTVVSRHYSPTGKCKPFFFSSSHSFVYRKVEAKYRTVVFYKMCGVKFQKKKRPPSWAPPERERHR